MLSKKDILGAKDLPMEEVQVPEWGGSVMVRGLNGKERDTFESSVIDEKHKGQVKLDNIRAKLCAMTICDEKGERLFDDKEIEALAKKSGKALDRVFTVATKLSGIGETEVKDMTDGFLSTR